MSVRQLKHLAIFVPNFLLIRDRFSFLQRPIYEPTSVELKKDGQDVSPTCSLLFLLANWTRLTSNELSNQAAVAHAWR